MPVSAFQWSCGTNPQPLVPVLQGRYNPGNPGRSIMGKPSPRKQKKQKDRQREQKAKALALEKRRLYRSRYPELRFDTAQRRPGLRELVRKAVARIDFGGPFRLPAVGDQSLPGDEAGRSGNGDGGLAGTCRKMEGAEH